MHLQRSGLKQCIERTVELPDLAVAQRVAQAQQLLARPHAGGSRSAAGLHNLHNDSGAAALALERCQSDIPLEVLGGQLQAARKNWAQL